MSGFRICQMLTMYPLLSPSVRDCDALRACLPAVSKDNIFGALLEVLSFALAIFPLPFSFEPAFTHPFAFNRSFFDAASYNHSHSQPSSQSHSHSSEHLTADGNRSHSHPNTHTYQTMSNGLTAKHPHSRSISPSRKRPHPHNPVSSRVRASTDQDSIPSPIRSNYQFGHRDHYDKFHSSPKTKPLIS